MSAKKNVDVQKAIEIHKVTEGPAKGWVHTHGLAALGYPELEIRSVPSMFIVPAAMMLNDVADYLVNRSAGPLLAGHEMTLGGMAVHFHASGPDEAAGYASDHYKVPRLRMEGVDATQCASCSAGLH